MAGRGNKLGFQVQTDIFDPKSMLDEQNWYAHRQGKPDELSSKITWLLGKEEYPLYSSMYGNRFVGGKFSGRPNMKLLKDSQFHYPVMSRLDKSNVIAVTPASTVDVGLNNAPFKITMTDEWAKINYLIETPLGTQVYALQKGKPTAGGFEYEFQINGSAEEVVHPNDLVAGTQWADIASVNAESESRGTEFKRVMPGKYKNQMNVVRLSHSWAGNVTNKVMNVKITGLDGKTAQSWMDYELYQFEMRWMRDIEHLLWYSRYNVRNNGSVALKDPLTSKVIRTGAGLLDQIPNTDTYSKLTYNKLKRVLRSAFFGQSDTQGMEITLWTGTGGMDEFDRAMAEYSVERITSLEGIGDKFVSGSNYNLGVTGFFDHAYFIDGYLVKVKKNPLFDRGRKATISPRHPDTGLPLESYRMVFIDDGMYDGEPNLQYVAEQGRVFHHGVMRGLTNIPRQYKIIGELEGGSLQLLSSDQDKASYHRLATCGIQLKRANTSVHLECVKGL